jgi:hypothetical protein
MARKSTQELQPESVFDARSPSELELFARLICWFVEGSEEKSVTVGSVAQLCGVKAREIKTWAAKRNLLLDEERLLVTTLPRLWKAYSHKSDMCAGLWDTFDYLCSEDSGKHKLRAHLQLWILASGPWTCLEPKRVGRQRLVG